jgi:hypothetical protein
LFFNLLDGLAYDPEPLGAGDRQKMNIGVLLRPLVIKKIPNIANRSDSL